MQCHWHPPRYLLIWSPREDHLNCLLIISEGACLVGYSTCCRNNDVWKYWCNFMLPINLSNYSKINPKNRSQQMINVSKNKPLLEMWLWLKAGLLVREPVSFQFFPDYDLWLYWGPLTVKFHVRVYSPNEQQKKMLLCQFCIKNKLIYAQMLR